MVRTTRVLFCDEEHGTGDITFPSLRQLDEHNFIEAPTTRSLRAAAKKAGWSFRNGSDYCDMCTGNEREAD